VARRRLAAGRGDLADDSIGDGWIGAAAVGRHAGIVHEHRAAAARDQFRIGRTQPTAGAGDDDNLIVEANGLLVRQSAPLYNLRPRYFSTVLFSQSALRNGILSNTFRPCSASTRAQGIAAH
jgi:hypothetical protein